MAARLKKRLYGNYVSLKPLRIKGVITEVKCPYCGSEVIVIPYGAGNYKFFPEIRPDEIFLAVEQICTNPECRYNPTLSYTIQVRVF